MKVAEMTIRTMERCVPASVPGIVFLSGGLSEEAASVYLNNMNTLYRKALWNVSFSMDELSALLLKSMERK